VVKHVVAPEGVAIAPRANRLIITKLSAFDVMTVSSQAGSAFAETILISVGEIARFAILLIDVSLDDFVCLLDFCL
jgi:hypothetical protein